MRNDIRRLSLWLCLIVILFFTTDSYSQEYKWGVGFGGTSGVEGDRIGRDAAGNIYVLGKFLGTGDFDPSAGVANISIVPSYYNTYLAKYDAAGNYIWAVSMGGNNSYSTGTGIKVTAAGDIYITGWFDGTIDFDPSAAVLNLTSAGGYDCYVAKYNSSGGLVWINQIGGTSTDRSYGLAIDVAENLYVTGDFSATVDFDPSAGVANVTATHGEIFLAKYSSTGAYVWAKGIGGWNNQYARNIAIDAVGNLYLTGEFFGSADFGGGSITSVQWYDAYVAKFDNSGTYIWANVIGTDDQDAASSIAVDASGNVYATGTIVGTGDFDPSAGVDIKTGNGGNDAYLVKYNTAGVYQWGHSWGGPDYESANDVAVDANGDIYIVGGFKGTIDFDFSGSVANLTATPSSYDTYFGKYDAAGNYIWGQNIGPSTSYDFEVTPGGDIYMVGLFQNTLDLDPSANVANVSGGLSTNTFIAKYGLPGGTAINMDGTNDYINAGNHSSINMTNAITVEAWINVNAGWGPVVFNGGGWGFPGFQMYAGATSVGVEIRGTAVSNINTPITAGQWYHAAFTWDDATDVLNLYLDGVLVNTTTMAGPLTTYNGDMLLGAYLGGSQAYYNGSMDEVRIWNRALCPGELVARKDCELLGTETGLVAYYNMNQGIAAGSNPTETVANDALGNSNGTLLNYALNGATSNWIDGSANGVTGSCGAIVLAEVRITGNSVEIVAGDVSPSIADSTDFGTICAGGSIVRNFTIENTGGTDLSITSVTSSNTDFAITSAAATTVSGGNSTTFELTFTPTTSGLQTTTITVNNNDCDENPYTFVVQGTELVAIATTQSPVLCPGQSITVGTSTYSTTGNYTDVLTAANGCDSTVTTNLTIGDIVAPVFTCPSDTTVYGPISNCEAVVSWVIPTVTDNCNPSPMLSSTHNPGDVFPVGVTTVTYTATDSVVMGPVANQELVFFDNNSSDLRLFNYDGSNSNTISLTGTANVTAVDRTNSKLYRMGGTTIVMSDLDGSNAVTIVTGINAPSDMEIDINAGYIFWSEYTGQRIRRANLDGTGQITLANTPFRNFGLGLDKINQRVYSVHHNAGVAQMFSVSYAGGAVTNIGGTLFNITDVAVANNKVYYTENSGGDISSRDITTFVDQLLVTGSNSLTIGLNEAGTEIFWYEQTLDEVRKSDINGFGVTTIATGIVTATYLGKALGTPPVVSTPNTSTCSFTVTVVDTVNHNFTQSPVLCAGQTITVGASTYSVTGNYTDVLTAANGCDSTVTTNLTVNPAIATTQNIDLCDGQSVTVGTSTYSTTGNYTDVLTAADGCDSTVTTNLTVTVIADQTVAAAQTVLCDSGSTTIDLASSEVGVSYSLRDDATNTVVAGPMLGTGAGISLNTGMINTTTTYNVFAETQGSTALDFDGSNDYVEIPHNANLNLTNATVEAWVFFDGSTNIGNIVMKGNYGYGIGIRSDGVIEWWNQFSQNGGPNSNGSVPVGVWTHIAVTVGGGQTKFYINGVLDNTVANNVINNNTEPLMLGRQGSGCNCNFYDGKLDELRIWNSVRTISEIQANMSNCLTGPNADLVGYWRFNEGSGSAVSDMTGNAADGVLTNMALPAAWQAGQVSCGASCSLEMSTLATVTVNTSSSTAQSPVLCAGQSIMVGTSTYSTTGNYTDVLTAANGCDSTVTTNLTVNAAIATTQSPVLCAGQSIMVGTSTYSTTGNYTDVLTAANGCDSTVTTNLTVNPAITTTQSPVLCAGQSIMVGTNTYSTTGNYTDVLTAANGCDSTVTTNLTVNPAIATTQSPVLCAGQSIMVGTNTYSTTGNYTDVLTAANGCDSTVTTNLTVNTPIATTQSFSLCTGQSITVGTSTYSTTGNYTDVLTAANGCDSTVTTNLVVNTPVSATQNLTLCAGQSVTVGASVYTTTGNYLDTITASTGCDSMVTTNLVVNTAIATTQSPVLCAGQSIMVGTNTYTTTGTYTDVLTAANGCDSTVTTNLTVNAAITSTQSATLCAGQSITVGTSTYSTTGVYTDVFTAANGCDSTVTTNLVVNAPIVTNQSVNFCTGGSITVGTSVYTATGNYTDVLTATNGCDSTVNTNLTVEVGPVVAMTPISPDTFCLGVGTIMFSGTLPVGGVYSGAGVNQNTFNPTTAGLGTHAIVYTVVGSNGCVGADSVVVVVELCSGIEEQMATDLTNIQIYPNPTSTVVYVNLNGLENETELTLSVYDVLGRMIESRLVNETIEAIDLSNQASGVYLIRVEGNDDQFIQRVIRE